MTKLNTKNIELTPMQARLVKGLCIEFLQGIKKGTIDPTGKEFIIEDTLRLMITLQFTDDKSLLETATDEVNSKKLQ